MNLSFSRYFPAYHPCAGKPTYFIEKILSQQEIIVNDDYFMAMASVNDDEKFLECMSFYQSLNEKISAEKFHTIRSGHRWKPGMKFNPVCWSGKPYNSNVIRFGTQIEVVRTWDFEITGLDCEFLNGKRISETQLKEIAANDGLNFNDFLEWFKYPKPFQGQIICWDKSIIY